MAHKKKKICTVAHFFNSGLEKDYIVVNRELETEAIEIDESDGMTEPEILENQDGNCLRCNECIEKYGKL